MDATAVADRARRFAELHAAGTPFLIANAWDGGSVAVLQAAGFAAIATSSGACAATLGRPDGRITREEALAHSAAIASLTSLPVSADLERGFGREPAVVAETIRLAGATGIVGGSIEDSTGDPASPIFELDLAIERVTAAVEAARSLPFPFTLTARCENHLHGRNDLDDTIRRLQAYERAGADVLFAPGLPDLDAVRRVCAAVQKPVNFMVGIPGRSFSVAELAAAGVRRISLAASLYRTAMHAVVEAVKEVQERGTFDYLKQSLPTKALNELLAKPR